MSKDEWTKMTNPTYGRVQEGIDVCGLHTSGNNKGLKTLSKLKRRGVDKRESLTSKSVGVELKDLKSLLLHFKVFNQVF